MDPKKILVVEDETFIADLYSRQLSNEGYAVQVANDGNSGLQLLETQGFDLLLLDIMLPGMNGLELLKQFKTKHPDTKMMVLLLTNLGQDAVIKEGFSLGASGYLIKASYTPAQIVAEVKNAFAGRQAGSPNPNAGQTTSMANPSIAPSATLVDSAPLTSELSPSASETPIVGSIDTTQPMTNEPAINPTPLPSQPTAMPTSSNMITASALSESTDESPSITAPQTQVGPTDSVPDFNPATTTFQTPTLATETSTPESIPAQQNTLSETPTQTS